MITVSYKDFISNSGNIQLDKIEDKLRNLFLVDSKIKLKEVDKIYTIDNINDFIRDISLFLKDEQKCSEENNQDIKQSLQVEQSIAVEQEDDSEYNVYRTWWGKTFAIFVVDGRHDPLQKRRPRGQHGDLRSQHADRVKIDLPRADDGVDGVADQNGDIERPRHAGRRQHQRHDQKRQIPPEAFEHAPKRPG